MDEINFRWRKADESDSFKNCPDISKRSIYYARSFTSGKGYGFSETNKLISNLKKPLAAKKEELFYKSIAIARFAEEASVFFMRFKKDTFTLVPIPPSEMREDTDFDDRLEQVALQVASKAPNVKFLPLLITKKRRKKAHHQNELRDVKSILSSLDLDKSLISKLERDSIIIVFDDVVTSGSSFEAAFFKLREQFLTERIAFVAWAKAKKSDPEDDFAAITFTPVSD